VRRINVSPLILNLTFYWDSNCRAIFVENMSRIRIFPVHDKVKLDAAISKHWIRSVYSTEVCCAGPARVTAFPFPQRRALIFDVIELLRATLTGRYQQYDCISAMDKLYNDWALNIRGFKLFVWDSG
jgi:hypothetical protein